MWKEEYLETMRGDSEPMITSVYEPAGWALVRRLIDEYGFSEEDATDYVSLQIRLQGLATRGEESPLYVMTQNEWNRLSSYRKREDDRKRKIEKNKGKNHN